MPLPQKIEISHKTIIFTVFFLLFLWLIWEIHDIIILLFTSFILTSAAQPLIDRLEHRNVPRALAIMALYVVGIIFLSLTTSTILPPLIVQSVRLGNQLPTYLSVFLAQFNLGGLNIETLSGQIGPLTQSVVFLTFGIFGNILSLLTLLVFTFYFLLERKRLDYYFAHFFGSQLGDRMFSIILKVEGRLGAWVRGQIILMLIIGIATYIGLLLLGIEYALALALIAGIMEIVPVVGPIVSAIPAIIVALAISPSPLVALGVVGLYFVIQQLENHLIVPTVMRKAVGLPPIVTLVALMVGGRIGGIIGAILAVPVLVTILVIVREVFPGSPVAFEPPPQKNTPG